MSQAVRQSIIILAVLLVIVGGVSVAIFLQKKSLEEQNQKLQSELEEYQNKQTELLAKSKKLQAEAQAMNERITQKEKEKTQIQGMYEELKSKYDAIDEQMSQVTRERDDWKNRMETARRERDDLMQKLKHQPEKIVEKIVYKDRPVPAPVSENAEAAPAVTSPQGEGYWAKVLKEKAALQLEIEKVKNDLDQSVLQFVEMKKQNSDLQLEIKTLKDEKEEIARKIKYGEDLANNLSVEVARARNDQKMTSDRAEKLKTENMQLQGQIKELTTTKLVLERNITRLSEEKEKMNQKLAQTENVIQSRIDEIWQIKQNLDQKISDLPVKPQATTTVDLPPIIVNAPAAATVPPAATAAPVKEKQVTIISINEANNFVIVDLAENDGSQIGKVLKVYRGISPVATLEVIQVRKDISAADIKEKSVQLKVGDIVR